MGNFDPIAFARFVVLHGGIRLLWQVARQGDPRRLVSCKWRIRTVLPNHSSSSRCFYTCPASWILRVKRHWCPHSFSGKNCPNVVSEPLAGHMELVTSQCTSEVDFLTLVFAHHDP